MDARSIEVLHRETGYLRLRLPAAWRSAAIGTMLEAGLRTLPGIERITWLTVEGKLAIRFDPCLLTHRDIARRLLALLAAHPGAEPPADKATESAPGLAERLGDLRERLIAATPARFRPLIENATTEKAITNFTNDIVAFYLIKVHWDLITKYWIKDPVKYANAWLTVFYLVFLMVRYRKT
ncbi:MAG: hypothetical protein ACK4E4_02010 [Rhodocyclaceae bacterium]